MFNYQVYDVFTDEAFGGNQLAVFPDADGIPEDFLQKIASEFNFSEVTFVYPPNEFEHTARVRIFTPTSEVDFAGHPTIGTAIALAKLGFPPSMILELGVGPIHCEISPSGASFTTTMPLLRIAEPDVTLVAEALGINTDAIVTSTHTPTQATLGLPFVLVELDNTVTLTNCSPHIEKIREGSKRYPAGLDFALFAYVRKGKQIDSRMFAPLDGVVEDPATGSASATLTALLTMTLNAPQHLVFNQGVDMGRPSRISASSTLDPTTVTIAGNAVKTMEGQFFI